MNMGFSVRKKFSFKWLWTLGIIFQLKISVHKKVDKWREKNKKKERNEMKLTIYIYNEWIKVTSKGWQLDSLESMEIASRWVGFCASDSSMMLRYWRTCVFSKDFEFWRIPIGLLCFHYFYQLGIFIKNLISTNSQYPPCKSSHLAN